MKTKMVYGKSVGDFIFILMTLTVISLYIKALP